MYISTVDIWQWRKLANFKFVEYTESEPLSFYVEFISWWGVWVPFHAAVADSAAAAVDNDGDDDDDINDNRKIYQTWKSEKEVARKPLNIKKGDK